MPGPAAPAEAVRRASAELLSFQIRPAPVLCPVRRPSIILYPARDRDHPEGTAAFRRDILLQGRFCVPGGEPARGPGSVQAEPDLRATLHHQFVWRQQRQNPAAHRGLQPGTVLAVSAVLFGADRVLAAAFRFRGRHARIPAAAAFAVFGEVSSAARNVPAV